MMKKINKPKIKTVKNKKKELGSDFKKKGGKFTEQLQKNKEEDKSIAFQPLILECQKILTLIRNISTRKGIDFVNEIKRTDTDSLGVVSSIKFGFLLENLFQISIQQIKTLISFFDIFNFGFLNIQDIQFALKDNSYLNEIAFKNANHLEKCQ